MWILAVMKMFHQRRNVYSDQAYLQLHNQIGAPSMCYHAYASSATKTSLSGTKVVVTTERGTNIMHLHKRRKAKEGCRRQT